MAVRPGLAADDVAVCDAAPDVADVTGKYFDECKEARISRAAADDALAAKLWDESERLVAGTEGA